ncbi:MAG: DegT/DnrJ/EryC1/StrS family aminotransferase [Candidatus Berkelbacteria bacterium]|nr:DegT/DnrJ/EryC1/StrS family aminotransferase [Candidatus Berkelbacteria bacterium]
MKIPLFKTCSDANDIKAIDGIIKSGLNWSVGPAINEFEDKLAQYCGTKYALSFNSGTSALFAGLSSLNIKSGDEIIVPAFTYIASVHPIALLAATPVFADIEKTSCGLDPADVEVKISKKTKAIIAVHYAGFPCRIKELRKIAKKHNIFLIEDAAESLGSKINGKMTGSFGDFGIVSFSQSKVISSGDGGVILTNEKKIITRARLLRDLGKQNTDDKTFDHKPYEFIAPGHNLRLNNILATLGITQLEKIDRLIKKRSASAEIYEQKLVGIPEIKTFDPPSDNSISYQIFPILAERRDELSEFLSKHGISNRIYFKSLAQSYCYSKFKTKLPVTDNISQKILAIPFFTDISKDEIQYVVNVIKKFYKYH